jgi:hypothetical protein
MINNIFGEKVFKVDDNFIYIPDGKKNKKKIPYPDVSGILNLDNKVDNLKESSYFIYIPNGNKYKKVPYPDINRVLSFNNKVDNLKESSYVLI